MDFFFSEQAEQFRHEIRDFIKSEVPLRWRGLGLLFDAWPETEESYNFLKETRRKLGEKGWLALTWPKEYGGLERSQTEKLILCEEMTYLGAPGLDPGGVERLGPILMAFGTEDQKRHLLPLARGETLWCQGFSEPDAGSDLASLQTRAAENGNHFILNGQKIWTTLADRADWCFLLARTDPEAPKHQGISFFLVDMKSPGITVRPLVNMAGNCGFNEVFFDNVEVPQENLVGEKNRGWQVANAVLNVERSGIWQIAHSRRLIDELIEFVNEKIQNSTKLGENLIIRQKLAKLAAEAEIGRLLAYRVTWMQEKGLTPSYEASISKLFGSELMQHVANTGMEILGLYGQLKGESPLAPIHGAVEQWSLSTPGRTIAGGTSEIQRNIIAIRGLGLPRH